MARRARGRYGPVVIATRHDLTDPFTQLPHLLQLTSRLLDRQRHHHPGELAWQRFQHLGREAEWPTAWWEADGRVLAWGWIELPGQLTLHIDPDHPGLAHEVLDWFETRVGAVARSVTVTDTEAHVVAALTARGYTRVDDGPFLIVLERDLDSLPEPALPHGYRLRPVAGQQDAVARAAVHAAAFSLPGLPPSRVTADSYRQLMGQWPYRADLDWIVEAADGTATAFCLVWKIDDSGRVALEPVGCHPGHRRRGLAAAASLAALRAARALGATSAHVCARGDDDHPSARALYQSIGFEPFARELLFSKRP